MTESSFSFSSYLDSDLLNDFSEETYAEFDSSLQNIERTSLLSSSNYSFNDLSDNSSIYDDILTDLDQIYPATDCFISQVLEENYSIGECELFLNDAQNQNYTVPVDGSTSLKDFPKKIKKTLYYLSNKLWSEKCHEEQLQTLHSLSELVTWHMSIKEQMEIIKIIDPSAVISPQDTEFALDISCLSDAKLKRIQDYLHKHNFCLPSVSKKLNNSLKNNFASKKSASKVFSGKSNSKTRRKQKKRKTFSDEDTNQKLKLELHGQKEILSGLFVYEKVIKLSNPLEDEDVNILE